MSSFFQRVFSKFVGNSPSPSPVAVKPVAAPSVAPPQAVAPLVVPPVRKPAAALAGHRPLMASNGQVTGFEFRIAEDALRDPATTHDAATSHVAAVLVAARLAAIDSRVGFARLPAKWLTHAAVPRNESGVVIGLEFDAASLSPETEAAFVLRAEQFRAAGAKLACAPGYPRALVPDYLLVRPGAQQTAANLLEALGKRPASMMNLPVIATDLPTVEDVERALQGGVKLASGSLASEGPVVRTSPLAPEVGRLARLLGQLSSGADTGIIVSAIKGDVSVAVRLLQRMNSATFAHLGGVASIDQAVPLLGRAELHRWLSLMVTQFAESRRLSPGLQEVALWRSRLLELLATERGEAEPGRFFTLGLASMLGPILKLGLAEIVQTLSLPSEAAQALVGHSGPWHLYLRTALNLENQTATEASLAADGFENPARVYELSGQAWAWAAANMVKEAPANVAEVA